MALSEETKVSGVGLTLTWCTTKVMAILLLVQIDCGLWSLKGLHFQSSVGWGEDDLLWILVWTDVKQILSVQSKRFALTEFALTAPNMTGVNTPFSYWWQEGPKFSLLSWPVWVDFACYPYSHHVFCLFNPVGLGVLQSDFSNKSKTTDFNYLIVGLQFIIS